MGNKILPDDALSLGSRVPSAPANPHSASYCTSETAPPFLKSLEPVLNGSLAFDRHFVTYLVAFLLVILLAGRLRHHEDRRVESQDDWLMEG